MGVEARTLTLADPFPRRFLAFLHERFPLLGNGLLIVAYYSSNQFLAQALDAPAPRLHYDESTLLGGLTLLLFFFHLRVFDEHKDYREDCLHHPERVLQRGLVTLRHLKIAAGIAIAGEIVLAALAGPAALVALALALGYSVLMLREFFVGDWLRRHFFVYVGAHMLVMPLLSLLVYSFTVDAPPWTAPGLFWLYAFVGFFVTLNWEVSRKIRAPAEERPGVETYSRALGPRGAALAVIGVRVVDTALVAIVGAALGLAAGFYLALVALFVVCLFGFTQFLALLDAASARRLEIYAGVYIIAFDLILALALVHRFGLGETVPA